MLSIYVGCHLIHSPNHHTHRFIHSHLFLVLQNAFSLFENSGSGFVSVSSLKTIFGYVGLNTSTQKCDKIIENFGKEHGDLVNFEHFGRMVEKMEDIPFEQTAYLSPKRMEELVTHFRTYIKIDNLVKRYWFRAGVLNLFHLCTVITFGVPPGYNFPILCSPNIIICIPLYHNTPASQASKGGSKCS